MGYREDPDLLRQWRGDESEPEPAFVPRISPGKRTLTMSLPPRPADMRVAALPVQRKAKPANDDAHEKREASTADWMNAAVRPDLHEEPEAGAALRRTTIPAELVDGYNAHHDMQNEAVQMRGGSEQPASDVHELATEGVSGSATALPFLEQIQRSFGLHDVSGIKAHIGGPAAKASEGMGASAYATGNHVAFHEAPDLHTAAHEAAHVVQQRAGVQLEGGVGDARDEYERNADVVADAVVAGRSAETLLNPVAGRHGLGARDSMSSQVRQDPARTTESGVAGSRSLPAVQRKEPVPTSNAEAVEGAPAGGVPGDVLEHLKLREGWKDVVYLDSKGKPTAGMGHLLTGNEKARYKVGEKVPASVLASWAQADSHNAYDAALAQGKELGVTDQNFIKALTSVNFQLGVLWHTIHKKTWNYLKAHQWENAAREAQQSAWYSQTPVRVQDFQQSLHGLQNADTSGKPPSSTTANSSEAPTNGGDHAIASGMSTSARSLTPGSDRAALPLDDQATALGMSDTGVAPMTGKDDATSGEIISIPEGRTIVTGNSKTKPTTRIANYDPRWNFANKVLNPRSKSAREHGYRKFKRTTITKNKSSMGIAIDFQKGEFRPGYTFTLYQKEFTYPSPIPGVMFKVFGGGSCTIGASSAMDDSTLVASGTLGGTVGGAVEAGVPKLAVAYGEVALGVSGSLNLFLAPVRDWELRASFHGSITIGIRILNGLIEIPYELVGLEFLTLVIPREGSPQLQPGSTLVALRNYVNDQGKAFFGWLEADNKAHELVSEVKKRHPEDWAVRMQRSLSTSQKAKLIRALNDLACVGDHETSLVDCVQGTAESSRLALLQEATGKSEWKYILAKLDWHVDQGPEIERLARLLKGLATREDFEYCGWEREWDRV